MKFRSLTILLISVLVLVSFTGCMTHTHIVGSGGTTGYEQTKRQWYVLWGLVPLGEVDTKALSGDVDNYLIETYVSPVDAVLNIFTSFVTIYSRTVKVTK